MKKRLFAGLLAFMMTVNLMSATASATEQQTESNVESTSEDSAEAAEEQKLGEIVKKDTATDTIKEDTATDTIKEEDQENNNVTASASLEDVAVMSIASDERNIEAKGKLETGVVFDNAAENDSYISFEIKELAASESIEIRVYDENDTLLSSTVMNESGKEKYLGHTALTAKVEITDDSGSWDTTWEVKPISSIIPVKAVLYVDGLEQDTADIRMYSADTPDQAREWGDIEGVKAAPCGTITPGYTRSDAIWGEAKANATESLVIEVYRNDDKLLSTSLNNVDGIIDGDLYVTWSAKTSGEDTDAFWDVTKYAELNWKEEPTHVVLYVDGVEVAKNDVQLNGPDNLNKINWWEVDCVEGAPVVVEDAEGKQSKFATLSEAVSSVTSDATITLHDNLTEDVTITQKEGVNLTIDGNNNTFTGVMTVFGNGRQSGAETLTIKNVAFQAAEGASSCIVSPDRTVKNKYSYSHNVTVDNCTFYGNTETPSSTAAIRHEDGGDKNWTITNCTVDENMHSLAQVNNVAGKLTIEGCKVESKNGVNLNSCTNVEITGCNFDVTGYAVRAGVNSGGNLGTEKTYVLENNTLKSACDDGDAVIMLRASAVDMALNMEKNAVSGTTHISGTTEATKVDADANYWDGKTAPVVSGTAVSVTSYYADEACTQLKVAGLKGAGTEADPFLINNVDELIWFRDKVDEQSADGSTQFAGKYFKLTADIDLAGINWNPIGSMSGDHGSFKGIFDGGNHTISNLNVQQGGNGLGLFARTAGNAEIKKLTLNNVTVKSTDNSNYVGGVVGNSYASTKINNVYVTGEIDISGRGYIGGISGHGYVVMDNVSVVGDGTISSTFWCAGGILGYGGEGVTDIQNAHVEGITITSAAGGLGAIVGMAEDNNGTQPISGSDLSAKDVVIKTYTGAYGDSYANYALGYLYGGNDTSELTGELSAENVKIETSTGEAPEVVDAVAETEGKIFFNLQDAINAEGATTLLRSITADETIEVKGTKALDLNGKTINGNILVTGTGKAEIKNGSIINTDSSYSAIESTGTLTLLDVNVTSARHAVRIEGGTAEINGGVYKVSGSEKMTTHAINVGGGTEEAKVTIHGGTFVGPNGTVADSGAAVNVQKNATVKIMDGTFSKGKNNVLSKSTDESANLIVYGGKFDQIIPKEYIAEGKLFVEKEYQEDGIVYPYAVVGKPSSGSSGSHKDKDKDKNEQPVEVYYAGTSAPTAASAVNTGDSANIYVYVLLLVAAGVVISVVNYKKRKL